MGYIIYQSVFSLLYSARDSAVVMETDLTGNQRTNDHQTRYDMVSDVLVKAKSRNEQLANRN